MKKALLILILLIVSTQGALAIQPAVVGGIRGGLALGIMADQAMDRNWYLRYGIEGNTSASPIVGFVGAKFLFTTMERRYPIYFGLGLVGYAGDKAESGISFSVSFERAFDIRPLFIEGGIDATSGSSKIFLQAGYRF